MARELRKHLEKHGDEQQDVADDAGWCPQSLCRLLRGQTVRLEAFLDYLAAAGLRVELVEYRPGRRTARARAKRQKLLEQEAA